MKTVAFHTLGCKLNFAETSTLSRSFIAEGYHIVDFSEPADVYIINTCSVTQLADKKCRNAINRAISQSPQAIVVATGCYAQLQPHEIAKIEGIDLIIGTSERDKIVEYVNELKKNNEARIHCDVLAHSFFQSFSVSDRTRSFLKIQDGCDYQCSYCTIPLARGNSRNISIEKVILQAEEIALQGVKEIVLTGVNIGDFGRTTGENFFALLHELEKVSGIERFRISSIEPNLLTESIIKFVAGSKKFMPHFHIPLQSGNNKVLSLMRRRYQRELFASRLEMVKTYMPNAFIGTDVLVGFPSETEGDFEDTYNFVEHLPISFLHVFTYSERPGTRSVEILPKVNSLDKSKRSRKLHQLSKLKHGIFYIENIGKQANVLFENQKNSGRIMGFTENYIKVETTYNENLANTIQKVQLEKINIDGNVEISFL